MKEWFALLISVLVILFFVNSGWVVQSYFEARSFNKITGKDVSTWDAMFLKLRVDCR